MSTLYRLRSGTVLHVFGDPILRVPVAGTPLGQAQEEAARSEGMEIVDVESEGEISEERYILFHEELYFTPPFLRRALDALRRLPGSGTAADPKRRRSRCIRRSFRVPLSAFRTRWCPGNASDWTFVTVSPVRYRRPFTSCT